MARRARELLVVSSGAPRHGGELQLVEDTSGDTSAAGASLSATDHGLISNLKSQIPNQRFFMATPKAKLSAKPESYKNYIGGRWVKSASGATIENRNPADTRDIVGHFPASTAEDVDAAVNAAV